MKWISFRTALHVISALAIIYSAQSFAECGPKNPKIQPKIQSSSDEVKASDLIWSDGKNIPKDAWKVINKIEELGTAHYALFDLNNDGNNEILIRSAGFSGSGGAGFIFLEKQKGTWTEIASFTGGFIISWAWAPEKYNKKYLTITQWTRNGAEQTFQTVLGYKNNKYEESSNQSVPLIILYSKEMQKLLLDINWMCWKEWN